MHTIRHLLRRFYTFCWLWYDDRRGAPGAVRDTSLRMWR